MASTVLANRNEPNWLQHSGGGAGFMSKVPYANPNPKFGNNKRNQSPSDDASSINRRSAVVNQSKYVTFNIPSYSKAELNELKNRLVSELEQIRQLKIRIESGDFKPRSSNNGGGLPKKSASKKVSGNKRPFPAERELKRSQSEIGDAMKICALGLHDYYDIIKNPMDLGTVKSKLAKNAYATPADFAYDVRLTFNNALTYNPIGHEVNIAARQFLTKFEELYRPIHEKFDERVGFDDELQAASSWNHVEPEREREKVKKKDNHPIPIPPPAAKRPEPEPLPEPASTSNQPSTSNPPLAQSQSPVPTPSPMRAPPVKHLKQPKPKARDPNKREMSLEEKHKLGLGLQILPPEKMEQVVQIIRKRNGHLEQDGDEIELDMEAVDTETLWELDRLVTNWKKMMVSKIKRQALMDNNNVPSNKGNGELPPDREKVDATPPAYGKKQKKIETVDEDVDIGDDMPVNNFPPVEIEKDKDMGGTGGHASSGSSSSGSSGSDSSSSSGSDSGSSSGSDSEADNGHLGNGH
ncbi:hypothetical protein TSUD_84590 [Trifolium subterraneum]|uniref:Bromo domain-containing protein n=1 Tax=Trifolium subterraneum TaxID=3900 RepID=A0A2Z6P916_TRISU|nr:hypothetical protein TSUD_84590 [Trifolium subterraneum]